MMQEGLNLKLAGSSAFSAVSSFLFGVEIGVVISAFSGSLAALSISATKRSFLQACVFVAISVIVGSVGTTGITYIQPGFPEKLSAFLLGLIAIPLIKAIVQKISKLPGKALDKWLS